MKVLITSDWYAPTVNGVVTSVLNLKKELEGMGHTVRVLTLSQTAHSFCEDGVTYLGSIGVGRIYPGARLRSALAGGLVNDIIEWHPDVVHSQCEFSTYFLARSIAKSVGAPLLHTYHTVYEDYTHYFSPSKKWGRFMVRAFTRAIVDRTSCVIAPTEKVRTLLEGYGVKPQIAVVPSGIDLRRFFAPQDKQRTEQIKQKLGIPAQNKVLLYVGRLAAEKNVCELLEAFKLANRQNVTLVLVGDGPFRDGVEQKVAELGLGGSVIFAGMVAPAEIPDYYRIGDLFVSASTSETQGLTYIEALASGLPCLCRRDACLNGILTNGINGWQYETQNEFAVYLKRFLAVPDAQMPLHARQSVLKYSSTAFAKHIEELYRREIGLSLNKNKAAAGRTVWTHA